MANRLARALQKVIHENYTPKEAFELYTEIKNGAKASV